MPRLALALLLAVSSLAAPTSDASDFSLRVSGADDTGHLPTRFSYDRDGCRGDNVAPALHWHGAPPHTRSFAVSVHDPDAPTRGGFWHWFVLDLPPSSHGLPEGGRLPAPARALRNDYGEAGWGGPCPPAGDPAHHYVFTVYALDVDRLALPDGASAAAADQAIGEHLIGTARQTLLFGR